MTLGASIAAWGSLILTVVSYTPYIVTTARGRVFPHVFSWFLWSLMGGLIFAIQVKEGAGPGAWATGLSTALSFLIFLLAWRRQSVTITTLDKILLGISLVALALWMFAKAPLLAVLLLCVANFTGGHGPTLRKSWANPFGESVFLFLAGVLKYFLAVLVLDSFTLTTALFPLGVIVANTTVAVVILARRAVLKARPPSSSQGDAHP